MNMMTETAKTARARLARIEGEAQWLDLLEDAAEEAGWFEPWGPDHSAMYSEGKDTLLVTFEQMHEIRTCDSRLPLAWRMADHEGWASLCVMAHARTWFRDEIVFGFLERLAAEGLFKRFDKVIFHGAGIAAHAACALSSLAPGAVVLAVAPQATLTPSIAGWDHRYPAARRLDFTTRYGFAPDLCMSARAVFLLYDPLEDEDAAHAALFRGENVTHLPMRHMGSGIEECLIRTHLLPVLMKTALMGRLEAAGFWRAWRVRRRYFPYLRRLLGQIDGEAHPKRVLWLTGAMDPAWLNPRFMRARKAAQQTLGAARDVRELAG